MEAVKDSVSNIKFSTLKSECSDAVGPNSDKKVEDDSWRRIMSSKMILTEEFLIILTVIFFKEVSDSIVITLQSHIFW